MNDPYQITKLPKFHTDTLEAVMAERLTASKNSTTNIPMLWQGLLEMDVKVGEETRIAKLYVPKDTPQGTAILSGVIRDHTPAGKAGHFQGIRMIFGVLLPMIFGPAIGAAVIRGSDSTYVDLGVVKTVPTPSIFLAAAIVLLLILPPVLALKKKEGTKC